MKLRICLSQFTDEEKTKYGEAIKKLGGTFDSDLKYTTDIIVTKNVLSTKYTVPKICL